MTEEEQEEAEIIAQERWEQEAERAAQWTAECQERQ